MTLSQMISAHDPSSKDDPSSAEDMPKGSSEAHRRPETDDHTTPWDYRDDLRVLLDQAIERKHTSAFRITKELGMSNGVLTNVLKKRRHYSPQQMAPLLQYFGSRLAIVKVHKGRKA